MIDLRQGDCLELMKDIPSGSVDLVLTDPPYGTMKGIDNKHDWDEIVPIQPMFKQISRVLRKNGKAVLFSQGDFTIKLINKVPPSMLYCYRAIWEKDNAGNCLMSKSAMVSKYEDICVFANKQTNGALNKQVVKITEIVNDVGFDSFAKIMYKEGRYKNLSSAKIGLQKKIYKNGTNEYDKNFFDEKMYRFLETQINMPYTFDEYFKIVTDYKNKTKAVFNLWQGDKSKSNVLEYAKDKEHYHPTQKPVLLLEDLIKTYSNEDDTVLDFTMGSGSTGVACVNTNRNFIGIELDESYFNIAKDRIYRR